MHELVSLKFIWFSLFGNKLAATAPKITFSHTDKSIEESRRSCVVANFLSQRAFFPGSLPETFPVGLIGQT